MSGIRIIETTLSVLLLMSSVRAAFSTAHCDSYKECVQKNAYGVWCFSTKYTSNYASCPSPWALPLQTHLNQNLSIAYYSPNGQFLGGTDYHVPGTGQQTYLCMSARVDPNQNATLCVSAQMDNTWYIDKYCFVDVVPSATKDGCLNSIPIQSASGTPTPTSNALTDSYYAVIWGPPIGVVAAGIVAAIVKKCVAEKTPKKTEGA